MATIEALPAPAEAPFIIYEDPGSTAYNMNDEDHSFISDMSHDADEPLPSIELGPDQAQLHVDESESEPEPYKAKYTSRKSDFSVKSLRHASGMTSASLISSLPSELSVSSKPIPPAANAMDLRYPPRRERPPFRNPSSVRAMQMASPPPFASYDGQKEERLKGQYKMGTPSRSGRSETPGSISGSKRMGSHRAGSHPVHQSPRHTPTPQQHFPLVLLHVTILPIQMPYDMETMAKIAPDWLMENYKLLEEKLKDIVLIQRGLLIPHPRDEYDLLEERLLESLELKVPRLLKCGHFVAPGDQDDPEEFDDDVSIRDDATGRGSRMSGGTLTMDHEHRGWDGSVIGDDDASICMDCHRHVKMPGKGVGAGTKRWDIKIFAANGLMRAGAWTAAWSEMERIDVEISPWIPEDVKKALEKAKEDMDRRQIVEEHKAREEEDFKRKIEWEIQQKVEKEMERLEKLEQQAAQQKKLEEALAESIEEVKESLRIEVQAHAQVEAEIAAERLRQLEDELRREQAKRLLSPPPLPDPTLEPVQHLPLARDRETSRARTHSRGRPRSSSLRKHQSNEEIPLPTLLKNYLIVLVKDRRNIAIALLSAIVAFLAMRLNPERSGDLDLPAPSRSRVIAEPHLDVPDSPFVVTTTTREIITMMERDVVTSTATDVVTMTTTNMVTTTAKEVVTATATETETETALLTTTVTQVLEPEETKAECLIIETPFSVPQDPEVSSIENLDSVPVETSVPSTVVEGKEPESTGISALEEISAVSEMEERGSSPPPAAPEPAETLKPEAAQDLPPESEIAQASSPVTASSASTSVPGKVSGSRVASSASMRASEPESVQLPSPSTSPPSHREEESLVETNSIPEVCPYRALLEAAERADADATCPAVQSE